MSKGTMVVGYILRDPREAVRLEGVVRKRSANRN
jgi:hypothetical protein